MSNYYYKSIFKFLVLFVYGLKLLSFNYNIQNNLTIIIIDRNVRWRWKGTHIEAGEFGEGTMSE